ncbi:hypothetical protein L226DRAFT_545118 [Lentinus tigrinus ALCF2SS1-7]|uniref:SPIN90/Ldb17 leucine-rich domain-containing protein n=1 Tax=Lentinus tigrinus ALCF2SS1-6 TaxID=1328759 RepID=A0A5C2SAB5_9APHY|nr:hypothetical protein L227DRAFT_586071 [Lentinus tigrinus ALCF2SS1-6]RPD75878.1 hypothetical protein L226DRAFT_545118 [Lentinus tigrinus ALCF2SS1-7]
MPAPPMDVFGIVYIIENAQQFWSELEEILHLPPDVTLSKLDSALRGFISFCAAYHEQYLQSPLQLDHACDMLLASELFQFHSERMCELMVGDAQTTTDPHYETILYSVMLAHGRRKASFLRSQKRWQPLLPLLMDHVRLDVDPEVDSGFYGTGPGSSSGSRSIAVPIEAKLRSLSVQLLYEVCRVQKMSLQELRLFDDSFIDYLFDLVEQTRDMQDETFNYSVIKLIVALNEQFMVASLHPNTPQPNPNGFAAQQVDPRMPESSNRVLRVLISRVGSSPTFGENLIFMLNRAERTPEDLCMQLLVLKLLYLLFTTKGMAEFFYTNDLCVLVDVFLREICNIDEENESLRHTYLRVLHPLLTKTQLRNMPYKRPQIVQTLESLIENETIRDVDPTTKRLVTRCMSGDWCVQFRKANPATPTNRKFTIYEEEIRRGDSPGLDAVSNAGAPHSAGPLGPQQAQLGRMDSVRGKHAKASRSAEHLPLAPSGASAPKHRAVSGHHSAHRSSDAHARKDSISRVRQLSGDSSTSLPRVAEASTAVSAKHRYRAGSFNVDATTTSFSALSTNPRSNGETIHILDASSPLTEEPPEIRVLSPTSPGQLTSSPLDRSLSSSASSSTSSLDTIPKPASPSGRRAAPPPPVKTRRKPPAVPSRKGQLSPSGGSPLSAIAASSQPNLPALSAGKASAY